MVLENPYAHSLDGLEIEDPVQSFFDYCKRREAVRVKRESGEAYPWNDDQILQKGRFLNVFREDDKVKLQERHGGWWRELREACINNTGTLNFSYSFMNPGTMIYNTSSIPNGDFNGPTGAPVK